MKATEYIKQNAHKFVYLAQRYPEQSADEIINLMGMPLVDVNNAIWCARDEGWLKFEDREVEVVMPHPKKKGKTLSEMKSFSFPVVMGTPSAWEFGEKVVELENSIVYMMSQANKEENDLEEHYLNGYLQGYPPRDHLIAVQHLLATGRLHEYQIEDGENPYLFYTLPENADKHWGAKQFKTNPLTGEPNEPEEEAAKTDAEA